MALATSRPAAVLVKLELTDGPGPAGSEDRLAAARVRPEQCRADNPYPKPDELHALARECVKGLDSRIENALPYRDFDLVRVTIGPDGEKLMVRFRWEVETKRNHLEALLREMNWIGAQRAMMSGCGWFSRKSKIWAEDQSLDLADGEQIGARAPLGSWSRG